MSRETEADNGAREGRTTPGEAESSGAASVLRVVSCGSVDDGKSTLLGRLLYECGSIPDDELAAAERDSVKFGAVGGQLDYSLLVDGLAIEREQRITVDVAFRYFSTAKRTFILADAPGHEQYTRNMVTAASTAHVGLLLIDARKGLLPQTKRHAIVLNTIGVREVIVAINKMDLVGFAQSSFDAILGAFRIFAEKLDFKRVSFIPIVARDGDNVTKLSGRIPWYTGRTLLSRLETADIDRDKGAGPFRLAVQWVNRSGIDFRGFSGTLEGGAIRVGDAVVASPSGKRTAISRIVTFDKDLDQASSGEAVTLVLSDQIDLSRGDVLSPPQSRPVVADQFNATLIWMSEERLLPHRYYLIRCGNQWARAEVTSIKHKIAIEDMAQLSASTLDMNDFASCNLSTSAPLVFDTYGENRAMGSFILVDAITLQTAGCGLINFPLRRATNVHRQAINVSSKDRADQKRQKAFCIWLTGLSGSGKSTIANAIEQTLYRHGHHTYILDGDNLRHGLCRDLGFTEADRVENIRRSAHVARLMVDAGLIVLASFVSPFKADRAVARTLFEPGDFLEVFVDTPLEDCERRDEKGLYRKARLGSLPNFTGISAPYEAPDNPEVWLRTDLLTVDESVDQVLKQAVQRGLIQMRSTEIWGE